MGGVTRLVTAAILWLTYCVKEVVGACVFHMLDVTLVNAYILVTAAILWLTYCVEEVVGAWCFSHA